MQIQNASVSKLLGGITVQSVLVLLCNSCCASLSAAQEHFLTPPQRANSIRLFYLTPRKQPPFIRFSKGVDSPFGRLRSCTVSPSRNTRRTSTVQIRAVFEIKHGYPTPLHSPSHGSPPSWLHPRRQRGYYHARSSQVIIVLLLLLSGSG